NPQQSAPRTQPQRSLVVADCGIDHRAGKAVAAVETTRAPALPVVESPTRRQPYAAIVIHRETVTNDRALARNEPTPDIGFAVSQASEIARSVGDPHAILLVGAKEDCSADDAFDRNVLDDAPPPDPKQVSLLGRVRARHQHPHVAVVIFGERAGRPRSG